jgi:drug/metabolite transporter (DMT)-like permease
VRGAEQRSALQERRAAVLLALLVTFLWATSWVLIKWGLDAALPPITFAGLRYGLAFLCLIPFLLLKPPERGALRTLPRALWLELVLLGAVLYALAQGAQFVSLAYLPAATVSLILNLTPLVVALLAVAVSGEPPRRAQWGGVALTLFGVGVYFLPLDWPALRGAGLAAALVCLGANAAASLQGRRVNRAAVHSPLLVTTISMGVGAALMLAVGIGAQGVGRLSGGQWAILLWLAVVNTAFAFTLWNRSLRTLTAVESSILNSMMMPQIAILAWLFLGEPLTPRQIAGMTLVAVGALIVQRR